MRLILEEQQKYVPSFINNATYHATNPDADVTYQTGHLFSSGKCFICFISDIVHITCDEILLRFQSTNILLLYMYRVHLTIPELYRQCCADFEISTTLSVQFW